MPDNKPKFLELLMILCKICINCDEPELRTFVTYNSLYTKDQDFTRLVYTAMRILINKKCKQTTCEDWLISTLYKIYKSA